mmetsp:Transcript_23633/g.32533  ORF Transcript_23633/g.32533 Transcript_23633/m.32533 type:complete len:428 (-) Transcript_23633:133-1416(-)|eukprot:CAMPEP_0196592592 /NCGR_PEP_ID=MMETSP1081-20130531/73144_1 /TAXON_ID=36882 /ORGANISM="Pyramimonas amylifera, Strain CCMP720" /LENGTH=427 /DNA_ID=CAMNT_0041916329 /DNA_START=40 /DNA_END=1323 /DNA_ORIENTATION=+
MRSVCLAPNRAFIQFKTVTSKGKLTHCEAHVSKVSKTTILERRSLVVKSAVQERALAETEEEVTDVVPRDEHGCLSYFPSMYNLESLIQELSVGGFSKKMLIYAPGGVADQMLLFPLLKLLNNRIPSAAIDIMCGERAHSAYDICPYVCNTYVYNVDGSTLSSDYAEMLGTMKGEYYDKIITAKPAGFGVSTFLWMACSNTSGYLSTDGVPTNYIASKMMASSVQAPADDPLTLGSSAYDELVKLVASELPAGAVEDDEQVQVGVPEGAQDWAVQALAAAGLKAGEYILAHGVPSSSQAAMTMSRFPSSASASVQCFASIAKAASLPVVFAVPREEDSKAVTDSIPNATILVVPNPSKLAAMVALSSGVVAANTAALPLASYMGKPVVGVFDTAENAALFSYPGVSCVCESEVAATVAALPKGASIM